MTSILKTAKLLFLVLICLVTTSAVAQSPASQTLTVSPTLFEMKAERGQAWTSELRVINVNNYDLVVYPEAVNFTPLGEDGRGDLIPIISEETKGNTLAEWITIPREPIIVKAQETVSVPISVAIPSDAPPGGHYAAILVGTKPPVSETGFKVQTAQFVTSLFFVRIAGEVNESASIREFTTTQRVVQTSLVEFSMRFQNTGNVHLQPQGDIRIFNMWGQERGTIPVNHQTQFGNVLPESIRKFTFSWKGETGAYDIGRYRAVATLGYGEESKQFTTAVTYFWVVPYTTILLTLVGLFIVFKLTTWLIRRYIERMIAASGITNPSPYIPRHARVSSDEKTVVIPPRTFKAVVAPMRDGARIFINSWHSAATWQRRVTAILQLLRQYILPLSITVVLIICCVTLFLVIKSVTRDSTHYEVSINSAENDVILSSEEIVYNQLRTEQSIPLATETTVPIVIVNSSGSVGAGARARLTLEEAGYAIYELTTDEKRNDERTVIVYDPQDQELALTLSKLFTDALLSAKEPNLESPNRTITIFAGQDRLLP